MTFLFRDFWIFLNLLVFCVLQDLRFLLFKNTTSYSNIFIWTTFYHNVSSSKSHTVFHRCSHCSNKIMCRALSSAVLFLFIYVIGKVWGQPWLSFELYLICYTQLVIPFLKMNFYWSIVALQCCMYFYSTEKWISYTYTYIPSYLDFLPT